MKERLCLEPGCTTATNKWRSCGTGKPGFCSHEVAYCEAHGGDKRATEEMAWHMHEEHRESAA